MTSSPILDELHQTRHRLLAEAGGTIEGLAAALRKRQKASGRRILKTHNNRPDEERTTLEGVPIDRPASPPK